VREPEKIGLEARHLDEMTCLLYIEGQLDRARGQEVSAHVQECAPCRMLLRALERESRLLTRAMLEEDEALPARLAELQERARRSMQWIWGLVLGLAATGAYALYTGYIEPWQQQLEQAGFGGTNLVGLLIFQGAFWKGWQSMVSFIEVLALMTLGGLCVVMFRRRLLRRGSALAVMVPGLCAMLMIPGGASATEIRKGTTVEITKDEQIKGDVYIYCTRARVDGTVDGDLFIFGQQADVYGHVTGDVIGFVQSIRVYGQVDGNVRTANNNLTVSGTVGKNVMEFGETGRIDSQAKVGGSLTMFASNGNVDGELGRDVLYFGELLNISGKIKGGVRMKGNSLDIASTSEIGGPVRFEGHKKPEVSPGAKLASPVEFVQIQHKSEYRSAHYYVWQVILAAAFVLFGLVLFLILPEFSKQAVTNAERYGASSGLGVLVTFGIPIAAIIACITVVGLFIGISTLLLWYASLLFAQVVIGAVIGQWLLGRTNETWPLIGRMVVGLILVRLSAMIPHLGFWIKFGVIVWGIGAISLAIYRRFQPVIAPYTPSTPMMPPIPPNATVGGAPA